MSTKIHAACDALRNPIRFILTGGESSDCAQALALLDAVKGSAVLADKGYNADYVVDAAETMGAEVVTPLKPNRKKKHEILTKNFTKSAIWSSTCSTKSNISEVLQPGATKHPQLILPLYGLLESAYDLNNMSTLKPL